MISPQSARRRSICFTARSMTRSLVCRIARCSQSACCTRCAGTRDIPAANEQTTTSPKKQKRGRATYTIKANDTLSGIAEEHGTTVDRLLELNPDLDPQGLVAGQKIKLRE